MRIEPAELYRDRRLRRQFKPFKREEKSLRRVRALLLSAYPKLTRSKAGEKQLNRWFVRITQEINAKGGVSR